MWNKIGTALAILVFLVGVTAFTLYLQTDPDLCDGIGFPVCTGSPDEPSPAQRQAIPGAQRGSAPLERLPGEWAE